MLPLLFLYDDHQLRSGLSPNIPEPNNKWFF